MNSLVIRFCWLLILPVILLACDNKNEEHIPPNPPSSYSSLNADESNHPGDLKIGVISPPIRKDVGIAQEIPVSFSVPEDLLETILMDRLPNLDRTKYEISTEKNGFFVSRDKSVDDSQERAFYLGAELLNIDTRENEYLRIRLERKGNSFYVNNIDSSFGQLFRCKEPGGFFSVDINPQDGILTASCYKDRSKGTDKLRRDQITWGN